MATRKKSDPATVGDIEEAFTALGAGLKDFLGQAPGPKARDTDDGDDGDDGDDDGPPDWQQSVSKWFGPAAS